jgi:predicted ATPase/DNA-binding XRE family transcriptional regulator
MTAHAAPGLSIDGTPFTPPLSAWRPQRGEAQRARKLNAMRAKPAGADGYAGARKTMATREGRGEFAALLQRYRAAAGVSQQELAERAGLSRRGISDLERGQRRAPHPATVRQLAEALNLSLVERAALLASGHVATTTVVSAVPLPVPLTSFIGRERELAEVRRLLGFTRLLTLTGAGGIGKTRLALEAARASADAAFVDLASYSDSRLVATAIAAALGIQEQPRVSFLDLLTATLSSRSLLLVLDNCEHLVTACAEVADHLLGTCPRLRILATSRQSLAVAGEQLVQVPPLTVGGSTDTEPTTTSEAVRLFGERARLVQHDFAMGEQNTAAVTEICRRLDGIPLAIELAAAHVRVLGAEGVAARLDKRLRLFSTEARGVPVRQQTLRAAIDWSYDLLSEPEQALFRRVSVFAGGWTVEAAETIWGYADGVQSDGALALLTRLVDKSLVQVEPAADGVVRFDLLETIREYAVEQLTLSGEEDSVRQRHAAYFLRLADEAEPELWGPRPEPSIKRLEHDLDNHRVALKWLIDSGDGPHALRLGGALARFWATASRYGEGRAWVARLLTLPSAEEPTAVRARLMLADASLSAYQGDVARAQPLAESALALMRQLGVETDIARSLVVLGDIVQTRGDFGAARRYFDEACTVSRQSGATVVLISALHYLSGDALAAGDYERARAHVDECLALAREAGYPRGVARALWALGSICYLEHDAYAARLHLEASIAAASELNDKWDTAQASAWLCHLAADEGLHAASASLLRQTLELGQQVGDSGTICSFLEGAAHLAAAAGQPERAMRLAGAAAAQREAIDSVLFPVLESLIHKWLAPARRALGSERTASIFLAGRAMSAELAVDEASRWDFVRDKTPDQAADRGTLRGASRRR